MDTLRHEHIERTHVPPRSDLRMTTPPAQLAAMMRHDLPPQQAFNYRREAWLRWLGELPGVTETLEGLPDAVDRAMVAATVEQLIEREQVVPAFVTAMLWGHGRSNYGPSRTARVLAHASEAKAHSGAEIASDKLAESVRRARRDGAVEGYRYLNNEGHIHGLGPAFFTKWLYFVTARGQARAARAAPVLDALVITWLHTDADVRLRAGKTPDYQRYVDVLQAWGEPHRLNPVEVEERIFRLIRGDGAAPDKQMPKRPQSE